MTPGTVNYSHKVDSRLTALTLPLRDRSIEVRVSGKLPVDCEHYFLQTIFSEQ